MNQSRLTLELTPAEVKSTSSLTIPALSGRASVALMAYFIAAPRKADPSPARRDQDDMSRRGGLRMTCHSERSEESAFGCGQGRRCTPSSTPRRFWRRISALMAWPMIRLKLFSWIGRDCAFSGCNLFGADGASFFHGKVFCEYHLESLKVILPTARRLRVVFDGSQQ